MNIYIAYSFDNKPISVLLADSQEKAEIAWAGMKLHHNRVEEINPTDTFGGVHGVIFLLTSTEVKIPHPHRSFETRSVYEFTRGI